MDKDEIKERIVSIIKDKCGYGDYDVTMESDIYKDLCFDEFSVAQLLSYIETEFNIVINDEFNDVNTVSDIVKILENIYIEQINKLSF